MIPPNSTASSPHETDRENGVLRRHIPRVVLFQLTLHHYRLPVWDRLIERSKDDYEFTVVGPLSDGEVKGGGSRPYIHHYPVEYFKRCGITFARFPGAVAYVKQHRPDVVIMMNPRETTSWTAPLACRRMGGGAILWSKVHSYMGAPAWLVQPIKRRFFRRYDAHIVYGQLSRRELLTLGVPDERIFVAQNTIDTDVIFERRAKLDERANVLRADAGVKKGAPVVVCVGRMVKQKRQEDLLQAWPRIRKSHENLTLVMVGGGEQFEELRRRARQIDSERIVFTGRVPLGDDVAWLAASSAFVVPGAPGLAINAALAVGCPTIVGDVLGADSEIVRHGETGWRYPVGDIDAMVDAIDEVLTGGRQVETIRDNGIRLMHDECNIDNMVAHYDAAIRYTLEQVKQRKRLA